MTGSFPQFLVYISMSSVHRDAMHIDVNLWAVPLWEGSRNEENEENKL